jgi:restriction endonuclease S subunit
MENTKKVPVLRFPKFSEEWEVKKLNDIADLTSSKRVYLSDYVNEGIPFYRGKEISELKRNEKPKDILYITREAYETFKTGFGVPQVNDILITAVGTLGNVYRIKNDSEFYFKDGNLIWLKNVKIFSAFLEILLEINHEAIQKSSIGSTQRALTIIELKKLKFNIPILLEQQKIADFLSQIDTRIEKLTKKKQLLESYKKAVMPKIFNQELRFKDNKLELRTGKLKDFGYFYYGKSAPKSSVTDNAKIPCVRYGELYSTYKGHIKKIKSYTNISSENLKFSKGGEILIPRVGEDPLDFANCSYLPIENVAIGEMISVYNTEENGLFLTYYINAMLKKQFAKFVEGGSVANLYFRYLENITITIPSIEEQTKIANFLTEIDDKINLVSKQLEGTKQYKQGLLQKMFV